MSDPQKPKIDFSNEINDFTNLFSGVVNDITDPVLIGFVAGLTESAANIATLKVMGAPQADIDEVHDIVMARARALANTPALIAAANAPTFMDIVQRAVKVGSAFLASALRYYIPMLPTQTA